MKRCCTCKNEKEYKCFNKNRSSKDGYGHRCKDCIKKNVPKYREVKAASDKKYREKNKDKISERAKEYRVERKEQIRKQKKNWHDKNIERVRNRNKKYFQENKDKILGNNKKYYLKNKDIMLRKNKDWRLNNEEKNKLYRRKYYLENKDVYYKAALRRKSLKHNVRFSKVERSFLLERDNYTCQICNVKVHDRSTGDWNDEFKAHIDHIVPISLGGDSTPENLRVLCRTCNLSKSDKTDIVIKEDGQIALFI